MRRVEVHGQVFWVPAGWTSWTSEHYRFQQRADGSIWYQWRDIVGGTKWHCVSPSVMPAERRSA